MDESDWNARYAASDLVWGHDPNQFVATELGDRPPQGRALDLACGEGRNAIWMATQGWSVRAVDFSEVAITRARELATQQGVGVDWVQEDLAAYEPPAAAFQLVLIAYLQVPWPTFRAVLSRAAAALEPGGELMMIGHARRNLRDGVGGPRDPAVLWAPEEIDEELRSLGLDVLRCDEVERPVDAADRPRHAIDLLARATRAT